MLYARKGGNMLKSMQGYMLKNTEDIISFLLISHQFSDRSYAAI